MTTDRLPGEDCAVSVLGGFGFAIAGTLSFSLPRVSQRLLAFLALRDRAVSRVSTAGTLWPDVSEDRAHASLRSAILRLNSINRTVVRVTSQEIALADGVRVDLRDARLMAHRILGPDTPASDLSNKAIAALSIDLLPDWYDDWAVIEAEEWRQLRLHTLDALAEKLTATGRYADAISAALAAGRAEPLRETSHAALIRTYIAEGNRAAALSAYESFRALLQKELGLEPTPLIQALIRDLQRP